MYRALLAETEPARVPYLAIPHRVQVELLEDRFGQVIINRLQLRLLVFDETQERIIQWIEPKAIDGLSGD